MQIGDILGDFELKDQNGEPFKSRDFRGKKILLSFHPLAFTPICRDQMLSLEKNYERFIEKNVIPLGISVDSIFAKKAWAESIGIRKLRMLCDFWPHGAFSARCGLFRFADGFSERANIIVSEEGIVTFLKIYEIKELPDVEEILKVLS